MPLHADSAGRILLAFLPASERAEVLGSPGLGKLTEGTITGKVVASVSVHGRVARLSPATLRR